MAAAYGSRPFRRGPEERLGLTVTSEKEGERGRV